LAKGVDVNARNNNGKTPLFLTAFSRGHTDIIKLLLDHGADVNAKEHNGETPLHSAALNASEDSTELLLSHGADVNAKDNKGRTPLQMTEGKSYGALSDKWYKDIAEMLRQHGATNNFH
jgi:ankyrin repeat protein